MAYTKQQTFDIVCKHLLTQGRKSVADKSLGLSCRYRGPSGLKCAVGVLIHDSEYESSFEGVAYDHRVVACVLSHLGHDVDLCRQLQSIHDGRTVEEWPDRLKMLAANERLVFHGADQ